MISKEQLLDKLHVANENFVQAPYDLFAIALYEFLDELNQQKIFEVIDAHADAEKNKDIHVCSFTKAEKTVLLEIQFIKGKIDRHYKDQKIKLSNNLFNEKNINNWQTYDKVQAVNNGELANLFTLILKEEIIIDDYTINTFTQVISTLLSYLMEVEINKKEASELVESLAIIHEEQI